MRLYISGPMSGKPKLNFPQFDTAAKSLRQAGYSVVSPAELDDPAFRIDVLNGKYDCAPFDEAGWLASLARDLSAMSDCDGVALLPAWETSRGAKLEVLFAIERDMDVYAIEDLVPCSSPNPLPYTVLEEMIG